MRNYTQPELILDALADDGIGTPIHVEDFRHLILSLATASSANMVIKFQGSIQQEKPDFSAAQSVSNMWDYIEVKDLEDGASIDGDTGITLSGTDDFRLFEMNVNGLTWINAVISSHSAGSATVAVKKFNDC